MAKRKVVLGVVGVGAVLLLGLLCVGGAGAGVAGWYLLTPEPETAVVARPAQVAPPIEPTVAPIDAEALLDVDTDTDSDTDSDSADSVEAAPRAVRSSSGSRRAGAASAGDDWGDVAPAPVPDGEMPLDDFDLERAPIETLETEDMSARERRQLRRERRRRERED